MSNNRMLGNEFQTAYESAGGTDILKFLANVKQAFQCITDLTARITGMPDSVKSESVSQLLVQQLDQTTFAESAVRQWEDDLHRFAAYLTPLEPPIAILDPRNSRSQNNIAVVRLSSRTPLPSRSGRHWRKRLN